MKRRCWPVFMYLTHNIPNTSLLNFHACTSAAPRRRTFKKGQKREQTAQWGGRAAIAVLKTFSARKLGD